MNRIVTYILCTILLSACTGVEEANDGYRNIRLRGLVSNPISATKAGGIVEAKPWKGSVPSEDNPLEVKLMLSMESGTYKETPTSATLLPCHTSIVYKDNSFQDPEPVNFIPAGGSMITGKPQYPTSRTAGTIDKVYCTGLYPETGWTVSDDGKTASHVIDGIEDLMFAKEIEGSLEANFQPQNYEHLLTWIKVCICATSPAAYERWGDVEDVYIKSKSQISIDNLKTGATSCSDEQTYTIFNGKTQIQTIITAIGSILCSPSESFTLGIKTSRSVGYKEVTVYRDSEDHTKKYEAGRLNIIEIYFSTSGISGKCTLEPWDYQDDNLNFG